MELRIDSWGFVFESGLIDLYIQRNAIIGFAVISLSYYLYNLYKNRNPK